MGHDDGIEPRFEQIFRNTVIFFDELRRASPGKVAGAPRSEVGQTEGPVGRQMAVQPDRCPGSQDSFEETIASIRRGFAIAVLENETQSLAIDRQVGPVKGHSQVLREEILRPAVMIADDEVEGYSRGSQIADGVGDSDIMLGEPMPVFKPKIK